MYNHDLTLIDYEYGFDEIGNQTKKPSETVIQCKVKSVGYDEFYDASMSELRPEIKFIIHDFEYGNQKDVMFEGQKYHVMRTYRGSRTLAFDEIELTCERAVNDGS